MNKPSKVSARNYIKLGIVTVAGIGISVFSQWKGIIDSVGLLNLGIEFQYNLLSLSGIIAGFLFTGVSILISMIGSERINRLWEHHYLDNVYYSASLGIISNIVNMIAVIFFIGSNQNDKIKLKIVNLEVICTFLGLVYFIWSTIGLIKLLSKMRDEKTVIE